MNLATKSLKAKKLKNDSTKAYEILTFLLANEATAEEQRPTNKYRATKNRQKKEERPRPHTPGETTTCKSRTSNTKEKI